MSGIAGAIGPGLDDPRQLGQRMASALRGSYGQASIWTSPQAVLCHVDWPQDAGSRQEPTVGHRGTRHAVFSGHIYNAGALRKRLMDDGVQVGPSAAIDDLLMVLHERFGVEGYEMIDGSFAFAIHDAATNELIVANDRFSSRPIYWAVSPKGSVIFSSQVRAVLQSQDVPRQLDRRAVCELIHYQRVLGTRTLNEAISMLPPGTALRAHNSRVTLDPWFQMEYRPESLTEREWAEAMAATFRHSVNRTMDDAERVGLLLSGGLDSRMVVAASDRKIQCFHFNDNKNQEFEKAREIAATRGLELTYLERPSNHYSELYEEATDIGDGLYSFVHGHPIGLLPRGAVDVMLHGHAPELYFRGPNLPRRDRTFFGKHVVTVVDLLERENVANEMMRRLAYSQHPLRPAQFFTTEWARGFDDQMIASAQEMVDEAKEHSDDPYDWFIWPDTRYQCRYPSFLFELSIRPFAPERSVVFHNAVLDLHLRMPVGMRSSSRIWNLAVRSLAPDIAAIPSANTGYSPFAPWPAVFAGNALRKAGRTIGIGRAPERAPGQSPWSWPNFRELIIHNKPLRSVIEGVIDDPDAIDPTIFDVVRIRTALSEHVEGKANYDLLMFLLTTFGVWHRKYGPPAHAL